MRVAMVVPGGVDESGTHRVIPALLWLIRRLARRLDVHVFVMRGRPAPRTWTFDGATIHDIGGMGRRTSRTIRTLVRAHRVEPFDLVHAFWASGPGVAAGAAARMIRRPLLLHVTGGDLVSLPAIGYGGRRGAVNRARVAFALASADRLTVPRGTVGSDLGSLGRPAERVPLGVDTSEWKPRAPRPRAADRPARLLHVASLNRVKDQPTLLRAMRRLVDAGVAFTLDIAGEDTLDGRIQNLSENLGLADRVRFLGFLPQPELRRFFLEADLLVMSSMHEADPVVALEAAVVGVPTVGTRHGHIRDWEPDAALAAEPGDDRALADAIGAVLEDDLLRLALAARAQSIVLKEDADWSADRVVGLYGEITGADDA
jgi:glycosyltransferase involved in cell wall biosynthesis